MAGAGTAAHFEDYLSRLWDVKYTFQYVVLTPSSRPIMNSGFGPSIKTFFLLRIADTYIQSVHMCACMHAHKCV